MLQCQADQYVPVSLGIEGFKALLDRISKRFNSRAALAKELGITPSRLSRALNTGDFPLNVANCLRLAKLSGENPSDILRSAGKADIADLIETLYGKDRTRLLTPEQRELLDTWDALSPRGRESLTVLMADLMAARRAKHKRPA